MVLRLLVLLLLAPVAAAQPFETLEVGLSGVGTFGEAPYTDYWRPEPGAEIRATTPFYLGRVTAGALVARHTSVEGVAVPDFLGLYFFGVWSTEIALPGGVRLEPGVHAGLFRMQFDTDDAPAVRNEAELAVGPEVWLSVPVGPGWRVRAGGGTARLFTFERIDLRFAQVGVSRTLRTPGWLRGFLR